MVFRYACFISYRRAKGELLQIMANDFCTALSAELEALVSLNATYRDIEHAEGGDFLDDTISRALIQSVCMIAVYTPTYFDKHYTYCAREFKAMEKIERERLKLLTPSQRIHGLIIPIIFRGSRFFPEEIKKNRLFINFENYLLSDPKMNKHPYYAPRIKEIADYIADRCSTFAKIDGNLFDQVKDFTLPSDDEVIPWLERITKNMLPFPGHEEVS